jgi:hypothetical protein
MAPRIERANRYYFGTRRGHFDYFGNFSNLWVVENKLRFSALRLQRIQCFARNEYALVTHSSGLLSIRVRDDTE